MKVFITGGAGFIGCNVAAHHLGRGDEVVIFDDLSRVGTRSNVEWLNELYPGGANVVQEDIRNFDALANALPGDTDRVYHLAAQVAVTTSVADPRADFEVNALGTFNVLEAVRARAPEAVVLYSSTNKVYGGLEDVDVVEEETRYSFAELKAGVPESHPLDFHSPYGCSKGAGDQYVRDYARIFDLRTVVLRQSCIYGTRQLGVEDQGWLAHFCISTAFDRPITIYGDGKQVRDVLWIDDLVDAYDLAAEHIDTTSGQAYNIGGGPDNTVSVWAEFGPLLERVSGKEIEAAQSGWRPGDQPVFVCDIRKATADMGWKPTTSLEDGVTKLLDWIEQDRSVFTSVVPG
jgi:CDP-paratose 2-epimerase